MTGCAKIATLASMLKKSHVVLGSRNGLAKPCRLWDGAQSRGGKRPRSGPYGSIRIKGGPPVRVHVAAAWIAGLIKSPRLPSGMQLDHCCERTLCIEISHFELVPSRVNMERRFSRPRSRTKKAASA